MSQSTSSHGVRLATRIAVIYFAATCSALAQLPYNDQEVRVHGLPSLMAVSQDPRTILQTSLGTILHDHEVCCGRDSALEDSIISADATSLQDVAANLAGRHLLSDGRVIQVKTEYVSGNNTSGGHLIQMLHDQRAALMQWNSHLYVVHTALYFWMSDERGGTFAQLHKLLLWDTCYSDGRRQATYTVETDDASRIQGFVFVEVSRP